MIARIARWARLRWNIWLLRETVEYTKARNAATDRWRQP